MIPLQESHGVAYRDTSQMPVVIISRHQLTTALRPVRRHLKTFKNSCSLQERKAAILREALTAIGERIRDVANAKTASGADGKVWEQAMWYYVAHYCPQKIEWHQLRRLYTRFGLTQQELPPIEPGNLPSMVETPPGPNAAAFVQDSTHQLHLANTGSSAAPPMAHILDSSHISLCEPPITAYVDKEKHHKIVSDVDDDTFEVTEISGASSSNWKSSSSSTSIPNRAQSLIEHDVIIDDTPNSLNSQFNEIQSPVKKIWSQIDLTQTVIDLTGPVIDLTRPVIDLSGLVIDLTQPILVDLTLDDDDDVPSTLPASSPPAQPTQSTPNGPQNRPMSATQSVTVNPPLPTPHTGAKLVNKPIPFDNSEPATALRNLFPVWPKISQPVASTSVSTRRNLAPNWRPSVDTIERNWNNQAREAGAASISFVNDMDAERLPSGMDKFLYLESSFSYGDGITKPWEYSKDVFSYCTSRICDMRNSHKCECQTSSDVAKQAFAYTPAGRFAFRDRNEEGFRVEVVECNRHCACANTCPNRASQKPRSVPIEIFKTLACGWGARSTVAISRGQVIGFHTGKILKREGVDDLDDAHLDYIFDIDVDEHIDGDYPRYSVDSTNCGNWTRFLNHSCEPVLQVYTAVVDCPPGVGLGRLVFVAKKNIPPRTELTIDYNPGYDAGTPFGESGSGSGGMSNNTMSGVRKSCYCGAVRCRGTIL